MDGKTEVLSTGGSPQAGMIFPPLHEQRGSLYTLGGMFEPST